MFCLLFLRGGSCAKTTFLPRIIPHFAFFTRYHCNTEMNTAYIFSAGDRTPADFQKDDSDLVIAADAGLLYARGASFEPDVIIGDFDSLGYEPDGKNVVTLPVRKDVTDTRYAVEYAMNAGYKKIRIYGGLGGERLDHSLSNISDCALPFRAGTRIDFGPTHTRWESG